jgi:DNA modification methylase
MLKDGKMQMFETDNFRIYNKDCGFLLEIENDSIDIIITGPPYNIGHSYKGDIELLEEEEYFGMLDNILKSSYRVLKENSFLVVDIAEIIFHGSKIWASAQYIVDNAKKYNFKLNDFFFYITQKNKGNFSLHTESKKNYCYSNPINDHSPLQVLLVFSKGNNNVIKNDLKFRKVYPENPIDEAYWHEELIFDFVDHFDLNNKVVLDPFLGSGNLLKFVINNCYFVGYEKSVNSFNDIVNLNNY